MFLGRIFRLFWFFVFCTFLCIFLVVKFESDLKKFYFVKFGAKTQNKLLIQKSLSNFTSLTTKKIVAYSLKKQIESDGKEVVCGNSLTRLTPVKIYKGRKWLKVEDTDIYTYSSYYDLRLKPYTYIRVIAMIKDTPTTTFNDPLYCHLEDHHQIYSIQASIDIMWYKKWDGNWSVGTLTPYLISCKVPLGKQLPKIISITKKACSASTFRLRIHSNLKPKARNNNFKKRKKRITVCVKPLQFLTDKSQDLVAWIEIGRILGARKFDVYVAPLLHPNIRKVLKFYQRRGWVDIFDGVGFDGQKRKNEVAFYNDCFYRNIHSSDFVLPIDVDEIILPKKHMTWLQMLSKLNATSLDQYASYSIQNAYFNTNKSSSNDSIFLFKHLVRGDFSEKHLSAKSFVSTKNALIVFNHYALKSLRPGVEPVFFLPSEDIQMNHYKKDCSGDLPQCKKLLFNASIYDDRALKYRDKLRHDVRIVLRKINH